MFHIYYIDYIDILLADELSKFYCRNIIILLSYVIYHLSTTHYYNTTYSKLVYIFI